MTLVNTKGMAFFGPGSEWFWAALQFIALLITFVAIYRQLKTGQSQRAVAQVHGYDRHFDSERMARFRLAILVALRDQKAIPRHAAFPIADYLEDVASLTRRGHVDITLLWSALGRPAQIWWVILASTVTAVRATTGAAACEDWEWLVGEFATRDRRAGGRAAIDAEWVDNWRAGGEIERIQDRIGLEQELRTVTIAPSTADIVQSAAAAPAPATSGSLAADIENERQSH